MRKIIFGLFLIASGCNNDNVEKNMEQKSSQQDSAMQVVSKLSTDTIAKSNEGDASILYEYKNDTLVQTLSIKYISKQEINFELTSLNKTENKTSKLTGKAKGNLNQDPETDEDDEGNAYSAVEYHYVRDNCSLSIRIDMDAKDKAKVFEYNCDNLHDSNCPFASVGMLKKVQK